MGKGLSTLGKTVLLTTNYMDEAQALADRVAIIADGRIVAEGPPSELVGKRERVTLIHFRVEPGAPALPKAIAGKASTSAPGVEISTDDPVPVLNELTAWALAKKV